jgi:hypothetical protein
MQQKSMILEMDEAQRELAQARQAAMAAQTPQND